MLFEQPQKRSMPEQMISIGPRLPRTLWPSSATVRKILIQALLQDGVLLSEERDGCARLPSPARPAHSVHIGLHVTGVMEEHTVPECLQLMTPDTKPQLSPFLDLGQHHGVQCVSMPSCGDLCDAHLSCVRGVHIDDSAHALEIDASYHSELLIGSCFPCPLPLLLLLLRFHVLPLLA